MCFYHQDSKKHLPATQALGDTSPREKDTHDSLGKVTLPVGHLRLQATREIRRKELKVVMCSIYYQPVMKKFQRILNLSLLTSLPSLL